jgi:hypothetical protein
MRKLNGIEDDSATGGSRPGAGAAPEPEPRPPQPSQGKTKPADRFRPVGRGLTHRRGGQRRIQTAKRSNANVRVWWQILRPVITGLPRPKTLPVAISARASGASISKPQETGTADGLSSSSPQADANRQNAERSVSAHDGSSGVAGGDSSEAPALPDVSGAFKGEMASLLAYYAAKIGAARRSLSAGDVAAVVQALMNEQTVAVRSLMERWQAATQRQRDEKPQRPTGNIQQRNDDGISR